MIAAALVASAADFGPGDTTPEPDSCDSGEVGSIDTVEIGDAGELDFVPLDDGDTVSFVVGGQGTDMLRLRIRISGPDLPECLAQSTDVIYGGAVIASETAALQTYEDAAGTNYRATRGLFLILIAIPPSPGESFQVNTTVGAITVTRNLIRAEF